MTRIEPCLWFDGQAEEAAAWYVSIFRNARVLSTTHYGEGMPRPAGSVLTVRFELDGETCRPTIEPMTTTGSPDVRVLDDGWTVVTRDGGFAAHYEHTVAVLGGRRIVLTALDEVVI